MGVSVQSQARVAVEDVVVFIYIFVSTHNLLHKLELQITDLVENLGVLLQ